MSFKNYLLRDICLIHGGNPSPKEVEFSSSGIPFVKMKDLGVYHHTSALVETEYKVNEKLIKSKRLKVIPEGCVLLPRSGSVAQNHRAILAQDSVIVSHICALEIIDKSKVLNKYLYYYLTTIDMVKITKKTTGLDAITFEDLGKLLIPLPPLATQKRIAEILDAADALRRKDQELLKKYDELAQTIFIDMFGDPVKNEKGWEMKRIGEVCKLQGGFSFKSNDITKEGIRLVKISNVHFEKMDWSAVEFLPNHFLEKYKTFTLNENDICIALTRPIIKSLDSVKVVMVSKQDLPCLLNQRVGRFLLNSNLINNTFLIHLLYSKYFKDIIEKLSSTSLQPNVGTNQIEDILIPLPSIESQLLFERRIKSVQTMKSLNTEKNTNLLFDSLIQKAFSGELVA